MHLQKGVRTEANPVYEWQIGSDGTSNMKRFISTSMRLSG